MIKSIALCVFALALCVAGEEYVSYAGHQAIRAHITTQDQVDTIEKMGMDVWSQDSVASVGELTIMVNAAQLAALVGLGVEYTVTVPDVAKAIADERALLAARPPAPARHVFGYVNASAPAWYNNYHTADETFSYLEQMALSFPQLVKFAPTIGSTLQGRNIPALVVTGTSAAPKKKILIQGGQHAREWVGPITVVFLVEQLVTQYGSDSAVKALLDQTEFHIIPLLNVDGYNYTWTTNRLWRKNRRLVTGNTYGVDLNRNWQGSNWCEFGASKLPSSDTYCGTAPFSEPETVVSSGFAKANGPYAAAIDYHSYSQLVLRPWGYTSVKPADETTLKTAGDGYAAAIRAQSGRAYVSEGSWELYYTTGSAQDYWKGVLTPSAPFSYTVELRPSATDSAGFQLPPAQIVATGEENWAAFKYFVNYVLTHSS